MMRIEDVAILVYYTTKGKTILVTTKDRVDKKFKNLKRFGVRQLGSPSCCDDCRNTSCWDYGKATRCSEKET